MSDSTVMNITIVIIAVGGNIFVAFVVIKMSTWAIFAKGWIGKAAGALNAKTNGFTNKAKEYGENRSFYQRRQMARDSRNQERRRAHVEDYAGAITDPGRRGRSLRRRAAGGFTAQVAGVFGRDVNAAGQQRVLQAAQDIQRKQRHEEAERAAKRMKDAGFRGDTDNLAVATAAEGSLVRSAASGQMIEVTHADRQAAINNLVQQGRTSEIRRLEGFDVNTGASTTPAGRAPLPGIARRDGQGGAVTDLHRMLDHAYEDYGSKLGDKAPDLMPDRRTTLGMAAFTDLKPDDVAGWHHSTAAAAGRWYGATTDAQGNALDAATITTRQTERDRMLRSFATASQNSSTRAKLSPDQVARVRDIAQQAVTAGTYDRTTVNQIQDVYEQMGGTGPRF